MNRTREEIREETLRGEEETSADRLKRSQTEERADGKRRKGKRHREIMERGRNRALYRFRPRAHRGRTTIDSMGTRMGHQSPDNL